MGRYDHNTRLADGITKRLLSVHVFKKYILIFFCGPYIKKYSIERSRFLISFVVIYLFWKMSLYILIV
jgi:hypothetical protein